jgi:hypothetical protein
MFIFMNMCADIFENCSEDPVGATLRSSFACLLQTGTNIKTLA